MESKKEEWRVEGYREQYKAKCIKRLKEWSAPLEGWYFIRMYDVADPIGQVQQR